MNAEFLKELSKEDVLNFIRDRLAYKNIPINRLKYVDETLFRKEHRRFEMSGYEIKTGECTLHNISIVNEFADLGIYDYTCYLFLDFYKGSATLYYRYFYENENIAVDLSGHTTSNIIWEIFQRTIFSDRGTRRRD